MLELIVDGIIYHYQAKGGVSRIYSEILPRMCEQDESVQITLLTMADRTLQQPLPQHPQINHRRLPIVERYLRPWRFWGPHAVSVRSLVYRSLIGDGKGQIWHSTYYTLPSRWKGKQVVTIVDMIYERYSNLFNESFDEEVREQKRRAVAQADAIICISETTRRDVEEFYGLASGKTFVVPLAHSDVFNQSLPDAVSKVWPRPFLLYVGRRGHYKNFDLLLEAFAHWQNRDEVDLIVVSDSAWTPDENQRLSQLDISQRVHLLTEVADDYLARLYAQAVLFAYPSLYEGFGIPLLEAMACGCVVVASDIPSTREVAGDIPIYFEVNKSESLVHALDRASKDNETTQRRGAGLAHAARFSWNETARQTLEVYRSL